MRYKVVPEPRSVNFLRVVRNALPLIPHSTEDCCARIRDATDLPARDDARAYLTFIQALGLAAEGSRGYHRTSTELSDEQFGPAYRAGVFGVAELTSYLGTEPKTAAECFSFLKDSVPKWERDRNQDWQTVWEARTNRLLEWGVTFGLFERTEDGYTAILDTE